MGETDACVVRGMSTPLFLASDAYGRSFHRVDLAAHLASGRRVAVGHIAVESPTTAPSIWGWPTRLFEIVGGESDGLTVQRFQVVEEHPSRLLLGPRGQDVEEILERPASAALLSSSLAVRHACLDLLPVMRAAALTTALAIIERSCHGWTLWALDAMRAATGTPHAPSARRSQQLGYVAA